MEYIRITSYYEGKLVAEHLYLTNNQVKAIDWFKKDYPAHVGKCIIVAESIDSDDTKWKEYVTVCHRCGVIN